mgnify:CR=1 FL=1
MRYLFKNFRVKKLLGINLKLSNLKIDVEDTVSSVFCLENSYKKIICNINLNYYENPKNRTIKLILNNGVIVADLNKNLIHQNINGKKSKIKFRFQKNEIFLKEISYFYNCIKNKIKPDFNYSILNDFKTVDLSLKLKSY